MKGIFSGGIIIIVQSKSSAATAITIVSIMIVKPSCLRTTNTQVCIADSIPRSITITSVMLVNGD
jgi:hypothetical protein